MYLISRPEILRSSSYIVHYIKGLVPPLHIYLVYSAPELPNIYYLEQ